MSLSYLHACESVQKCVRQKLMHLLSKHVCVCACVWVVCHAHLALVAAEWGIPIIIIKLTLFSLFEVRRLPLPLATTFQPAQPINPYTHTHACTQTLLCAVPQARAIVRVITWSVVCLVTFSLYELRAFHSPSILSIDSNLVCLCVCLCLWVRMWLPFSFYQQIGHRVPHYLAN